MTCSCRRRGLRLAVIAGEGDNPAHARPDRAQRHPRRRPAGHRCRRRGRTHCRGRAASCRPRPARPSTPQSLLLAPPFVDSHFHMDATLSVGLPRRNRSGTLLEGIALWGELKPPDPGGDRRTGAGLLRLGGGAGPAGDPQPCRHLRPPPSRRRRAARREEEGGALHRSPARRLPPGRPLSLARRPGAFAGGAAARRRRRGRHSSFRAHDGGWPRVGPRALRDRGGAGLLVDMHCDETDDPLSRHVETLAAETVASACRAAWWDRTLHRCTAWTTTMSPSSFR